MNEETTGLRPLEQENTGHTEIPAADKPQDAFSKMRTVGIAVFGFFVFFLVLLFKLPEARIQNLMIGHARVFFQNQGLSFSAEKVKLSLIFGPAVKFYNVEVRALEDSDDVLKIPYLKISPNLSSMLGKNKAFSFSAEMLGGSMSGSIGGSSGPSDSFSIDLTLKNIDPGSTPLFKRYMMVSAKGKMNGDLRLDFDSAAPTKTTGKIRLNLKDILLPDQIVYGFNLPALKISQCVIEVPIESGRAEFKHIECGKAAKNDDIAGQLTGQIVFDRVLTNSKLSAKASFQLSDTVKKAFPLLEAILAGGKSADGSFAYRLGGTIGAIEPVPGS